MKLFIAIPSRSGRLLTKTALELCSLSVSAHKMGLSVVICIVDQNPIVADARNCCIDEFMRSDSTHLLFIDDDIVFAASDVEQLMRDAQKYDVIVTDYARRKIHGGCTIVAEIGSEVNADGYIEVSKAGLGFAMISRVAINSITNARSYCDGDEERHAWCECKVVKGLFVGDDESLLRKLRAAGYRPICNLNIKLGHVGDCIY